MLAQITVLVLLLVGVLRLSPCSGCEWEATSQIQWSEANQASYVTSVSVGGGGVWAISWNRGRAVYKDPTLDEFMELWSEFYERRTHWGGYVTTETLERLMKQLDVGSDTVWGVSEEGFVCYRRRVLDPWPTGTPWMCTSGNSHFRHVTVSPNGQVWAVREDNKVFYRTGITEDRREGTGWTRAGQGVTEISAGPAGLWAATEDGYVWYRVGTYGDAEGPGTSWQNVPSMGAIGRVKHVSSGDGFALAVNETGAVFKRRGVSAEDPNGSSWQQVAEGMREVDTYGCQVWAIDNSRNMKFVAQ